MTSRSRRGADPTRSPGVLRLLFALIMLAGPWLASAQTVSSITFAPTSIATGGKSRLTIALGNAIVGAGPAILTQTLTDTLPAGLTVANPAAIGGTCTVGAVGAAAGGGAITYAADASIPTGGCTITVSVTATSAARSTYYTDSIAAGALVTTLGSNPASASGTLTVLAAVAVPNLVGLSQTAAATALQAAGLALGTVTKAPGPAAIPYNAVFTQAPAAGATVPGGSTVLITISTGKGLATNPNEPLTSVTGFVAPYQLSEAGALERVCAALQSADPSTLSVSQRNLLANCLAIIGTYGGGVNAAGLKNTLDALSGQQTTAQQRTGVQFAGAQFTNIGTRLAQLRQGVNGASFAGLDPGLPAGNGVAQILSSLAHEERRAAHRRCRIDRRRCRRCGLLDRRIQPLGILHQRQSAQRQPRDDDLRDAVRFQGQHDHRGRRLPAQRSVRHGRGAQPFERLDRFYRRNGATRLA